jgi:hypothetical protein
MADLADDLTPDQPAEHPIVTVMKRLLGDTAIDERLARAARGDKFKGQIVEPEHTTQEDDDVANWNSSPQAQEYRSIRL